MTKTIKRRGVLQAAAAVGAGLASPGLVRAQDAPAELAALIKVEAATWGPIIRSNGFKPLE